MPALKTLAQVEKEKNATFPLRGNDKDLTPEELEAEQKAEKFPIDKFPRISPVPGTLAFLLRSFRGRNESVIEFLEWTQKDEHPGRTKAQFIKNFIIIWNNMDEWSRKRVDIFDVLCRKYEISRKRFWGILQEGIFDFHEELTQTALSGFKPEFIHLVNKMATKERHHQDRRLMAEMLGVTKAEPLVKIEDNSQTTNVTNIAQFPSFSDSIRRSEQGIRHKDIAAPKVEQKQLTEGEQNYIEAEWSDIKEEEKELVSAEAAFKKAAEGLT
jgi:hypothetical protein